METLTQMQNIGKVLEGQLRQVGITTPAQLRAVGAREAWLRILAIDPSTCINRLCGLEGAVQGVRWHRLDDATKEALRAFYKKAKGQTP